MGFNLGQQKTIKQFLNSKEALQFDECEIKQARRGSNMEIMLKGTTQIKVSPRKFEVSKTDLDDDTPSEVELANIDSLNVYNRVTVNVKFVKCSDEINIANDKKKQEIIIGISLLRLKSRYGKKTWAN